MSSYTEDTANDLADKALAEAEASGSTKIVDLIDELLGASSQSLQEAYSTAVRVRRAETRARALLAESAIKRGATPPPKPEKKAVKPDPEPAPEAEPEVIDTPEPEEEKPVVAEKPKRKGW